jgi:hypothetical protein
MIEQAPILITGIARSGTSMIARVVNCCGAFAGEGATHRKRMFENVIISNRIVRPYMERMGTDPKGQFPLPVISDLTIPVDWRERVENIIKEEGYKDGPWMYKDTKMGLIWPVWHSTFPKAKWVIVRRRTGDVIQSCLKTGYMTAYETEDGWLEWVHAHEERFRQMIEAGIDYKVIWPERMMNRDFQQLYEIIDWLGLTWKDEALNFIDPLLWGNKERRTV